jgi:hypothetical protein
MKYFTAQFGKEKGLYFPQQGIDPGMAPLIPGFVEPND